MSPIRLNGNTSGYTELSAPAVANDRVFVLPNSYGTNGELLQTDGSGNLSWNGGYSLLDSAQTFTKGQRGEITTLTDAATIAVDFNDSNNFKVTLGGSRTLGNPTNIVAGQSGLIVIQQDGAGSKTLSYGAYWKFSGGTAPTLTTAANAIDVLSYFCLSTTQIIASLLLDVK